mmetsp:Transcript_32485/g.100519  ORF Transcript_32485/g.100519 Transcript_32485/m.100519 type:complete len:205 (-) Transcript_32485:197-811(-)
MLNGFELRTLRGAVTGTFVESDSGGGGTSVSPSHTAAVARASATPSALFIESDPTLPYCGSVTRAPHASESSGLSPFSCPTKICNLGLSPSPCWAAANRAKSNRSMQCTSGPAGHRATVRASSAGGGAPTPVPQCMWKMRLPRSAISMLGCVVDTLRSTRGCGVPKYAADRTNIHALKANLRPSAATVTAPPLGCGPLSGHTRS